MDGLALILVGFLLGVPVGMLILACGLAVRSRRGRRADADSAPARRG